MPCGCNLVYVPNGTASQKSVKFPHYDRAVRFLLSSTDMHERVIARIARERRMWRATNVSINTVSGTDDRIICHATQHAGQPAGLKHYSFTPVVPSVKE